MMVSFPLSHLEALIPRINFFRASFDDWLMLANNVFCLFWEKFTYALSNISYLLYFVDDETEESRNRLIIQTSSKNRSSL